MSWMHHLIVMSWVSRYGCVVVALLLWHFIEPWGHCHFITGTIYLGAFMMSSCVVGNRDSSTQRPCNDLTHKLFDLFASSTLVTPRVPCFHFGCHCYGWSSCLSMWLDWKDIKLVMANGHCSASLQRLHCSDMHACILETPLLQHLRSVLYL
jgi:hypothetical protein